MNPNTRVVLVHPRWRTVHELYENGTAADWTCVRQ